jgi:hypothetical protein
MSLETQMTTSVFHQEERPVQLVTGGLICQSIHDYFRDASYNQIQKQ